MHVVVVFIAVIITHPIVVGNAIFVLIVFVLFLSQYCYNYCRVVALLLLFIVAAAVVVTVAVVVVVAVAAAAAAVVAVAK